MNVILPLLMCLFAQKACAAAFVTPGAAVQRSLHQRHAMNTDEQERWKKHDAEVRKALRVEFSHDDWVEYRTNRRFGARGASLHRNLHQRRVVDTDEKERWKKQDAEMREEFRVEFDHDDWVEYRTNRRFNDMQDIYLPFLAALVAFMFYVAIDL